MYVTLVQEITKPNPLKDLLAASPSHVYFSAKPLTSFNCLLKILDIYWEVSFKMRFEGSVMDNMGLFFTLP